MCSFSLPYGRFYLQVQMDGARLKGVLRSRMHMYKEDRSEEEIISKALQSPIHSPPLRELAKGKERILIISSDHTRPVPSHISMPLLLKEIRAGHRESQITILVATGFHRATTHEELRNRYGDELVQQERIHVHDCINDEMVDLGLLPSGGRLFLNSLVENAQLIVAEGFIEPHFFAGFSGGRKSILPGISCRNTVLANHCAEFIHHPLARAGILEGNPIHADMMDAANKAGLSFILNVVNNSQKQVINAFAGDIGKAHLKGCEFVSHLASVDAIPAPIVITTNGGYPLDQNIYQAVKGMAQAEATCEEGGVIIAVSCCEDGHGSKDFFNTFARNSSPREIMDGILKRDRYSTLPDQWEAQILAKILLKHRVIMVTQAPQEMVEAMMMEWAPTVEEALMMAYDSFPKGKVTVIPDGVSVIVRRKSKGDSYEKEG